MLKNQSIKDQSNLITWNSPKEGKCWRYKMAQKADENSEQLVIDLADDLCMSITSYNIEAGTDY